MQELENLQKENEQLKAQKEDLETINDSLLSHNNFNQKVKYIHKLKQDHNDAVALKEKYQRNYEKTQKQIKELRRKSGKVSELISNIQELCNSGTDSFGILKLIEEYEPLNMDIFLTDITNQKNNSENRGLASTSKIFNKSNSLESNNRVKENIGSRSGLKTMSYKDRRNLYKSQRDQM